MSTYYRESNVEKGFRLGCVLHGWLALKFVVPSIKGYPDRIVFKGRGKIEFVELKSPDGEPPPAHQLRRHEELRRLGFTVSVLDSKEAVEKWFADRS